MLFSGVAQEFCTFVLPTLLTLLAAWAVLTLQLQLPSAMATPPSAAGAGAAMDPMLAQMLLLAAGASHAASAAPATPQIPIHFTAPGSGSAAPAVPTVGVPQIAAGALSLQNLLTASGLLAQAAGGPGAVPQLHTALPALPAPAGSTPSMSQTPGGPGHQQLQVLTPVKARTGNLQLMATSPDSAGPKSGSKSNPDNRPGQPRFMTNSQTCLEHTKVLLERNQQHVQQELNKDKAKCFESHANACRVRVKQLNERESSSDIDVANLKLRLEAAAAVCDGFKTINASFLKFQLSGGGLVCLSEVSQVIEQMESTPAFREFWRSGYHVPPYQREHLALFKVQHLVRGEWLAKDMVKLINSTAAGDIGAPHIIEKYYDRAPQYATATSVYAQHLRCHWDHAKIQSRLFSAAFGQMCNHCQDTQHLIQVFMKIFGPRFSELSDKDKDPSGSTGESASPSKRRRLSETVCDPNAPSDNEEGGGMDHDSSSDISEFEAALDVLPETEDAKKSSETLIISNDLATEVHGVLALLIPKRFQVSDTRAALIQFDAGSQGTSPLLKSIAASKIVRSLAAEAKQYIKICDDFKSWLAEAASKMKSMSALHDSVASLMNSLTTLSESNSDETVVAKISHWYKEFNLILKALPDADFALQHQAKTFADPSVVRQSAGVLEQCKGELIRTIDNLSVLAKTLATTVCKLSLDKNSKRDSKEVILKSAGQITGDMLGANHTLHICTTLDRTDRVLQVRQLVDHMLHLRGKHLTEFEDSLGRPESRLSESARGMMPALSQEFEQFSALAQKMDWAKSSSGSLTTVERSGILSAPIFNAADISLMQTIAQEHEARCAGMVPFKCVTYKAYLEAKGPSKVCMSVTANGQQTHLFPGGTLEALVNLMQVGGGEDIHTPLHREAQEHMEAISHLASLHDNLATSVQTPSDELFTTSISMAAMVADLQKSGAKVALNWGSEGTQTSEMIPEQLVACLKALRACILDAETLEPATNAVLLKLQSSGLDDQDKEISGLVVPLISAFPVVIENSKSLLTAVRTWSYTKVTAVVSKAVNSVQACYYLQFREWYEPSQRNFQSMRKRMLKNRNHDQVQKGADKLLDIAEQLEMRNSYFNSTEYFSLQEQITTCKRASDSASLYIAASSAFNTVFFKVQSQMDPIELCKDAKICIMGLERLGRWFQPDGGEKEVIPEARIVAISAN